MELNTSIEVLQSSVQDQEKNITRIADTLLGQGEEQGFVVDVNNKLTKLEALLERQEDMLAQNQKSMDKLLSTADNIDRKIRD